MKNLVLLGFMGSGKTTVGRRVAATLKMQFVDVDRRIEETVGKTISEIFAEKGETAFREIESCMVAKLAAQSGQVIATGGGVVLKSSNLEALGKNGVLIHLHVDPETVRQRTSRSRRRPLLQGENPDERIRELFAQRFPLYEAIPNQVNTVGRNLQDVCADVMRIFRGDPGSHGK